MGKMKKIEPPVRQNKIEFPESLFTRGQIKKLEMHMDIKEYQGSLDTAIFQHSILCSVFFPYRRKDADAGVWSRSINNSTLNLNAIERRNRRTGETASYGLPYGSTARLIMAYVNTVAVKQQDPVVNLGDHLNRFIEALGKKSKDGRTVNAVRDQLNRITHSHISIEFDMDYGDVTRSRGSNLLLIEDWDLWYAKKGEQAYLFPSFIKLSDRYFDNLMEHAVPLDERAVYALSQNALGLDIYAWLSQRLHRLNKPVRITWKALKDQFGGYNRMDDFKRAFRRALTEALKVYPTARIEEENNQYFTLFNSPPPIPPAPRLIVSK